jgi:hypothetical protein
MRGGVLAVAFQIEGDLDRVRVPEPRAPRIGAELWRHTCGELFVRIGDAAGYHEFNFSPSGAWAGYMFERYREGEPLKDERMDLQVTARRRTDTLELGAAVPLWRLSSAHAQSKLSLGVSVVIEAHDASLSYWALAHAPGKPDFHHPVAFALELDEVRD